MKLKIFSTGFLQVFLVVINTYFISKSYLLGIIICGFLISFIWSHNVKKIAFGTENERLIYSLGAMTGSVLAFDIGKIII